MNEETQPMKPEGIFSEDPSYGKSDNCLVGIVGHCNLGRAVEKSFIPAIDRIVVDPEYGITVEHLIDREPNITFVCSHEQPCETVIELLRSTQSAVILKTTINMQEMDKMMRTIFAEESIHRFIYAPDLSSDQNTEEEYMSPEYVILGGNNNSVQQLLEFFHWNTYITMPQQTANKGGVHVCLPTEALIAFLAIQAYLASKSMFFSELYEVMSGMTNVGVNFPTTARAVIADSRIGKTNWFTVGKIDTSALEAIVASHEGSLPLFETIIKSNEGEYV